MVSAGNRVTLVLCLLLQLSSIKLNRTELQYWTQPMDRSSAVS